MNNTSCSMQKYYDRSCDNVHDLCVVHSLKRLLKVICKTKNEDFASTPPHIENHPERFQHNLQTNAEWNSITFLQFYITGGQTAGTPKWTLFEGLYHWFFLILCGRQFLHLFWKCMRHHSASFIHKRNSFPSYFKIDCVISFDYSYWKWNVVINIWKHIWESVFFKFFHGNDLS